MAPEAEQMGQATTKMRHETRFPCRKCNLLQCSTNSQNGAEPRSHFDSDEELAGCRQVERMERELAASSRKLEQVGASPS